MTFSLDYDQLASKYAQHRDIHPHVLPNLIASGEIADASQVLEVGCGTGNYIVALQEASGCIWQCRRSFSTHASDG